jgi:hypothetical protein
MNLPRAGLCRAAVERWSIGADRHGAINSPCLAAANARRVRAGTLVLMSRRRSETRLLMASSTVRSTMSAGSTVAGLAAIAAETLAANPVANAHALFDRKFP